MSFGKRVTEARKKKGLSQNEVAKHIGSMAPVVGRYERDETKPSIQVAAKLADLLEISLDYLVGNSDQEIDTKTLNRVLEIQNLPEDVRDRVFHFIDMSIRDTKARKAYG